MYHVRPTIQETADMINDGTLYIYANSKVDDGSLIAELMQYMAHTKGENLHFPKLSNRVKMFKENEEGINAMCEIMERERMEGRIEGRMEGKMEGRIEKELDLIQKKLNKHKSVKQIADELEETVENIQNMIITYREQFDFPE